MAQWFVPRRVWPEDERADIASFDLILSYLNDPDGVMAANLRSAGARLVIDCPAIVTNGHAADHFLRPVRELGIAPVIVHPLLPWPEALREQGRKRLKELGLTGKVVGMHPGSGSSRKNWPIEKFVALADYARGRASLQPLFILGEAEAEAARKLPRLASTVPVLANRRLTEAASVLAACRVYVGNDSGVTHLAAALGIPVVALFGPTDAAVWGPRGANVAILTSRAPTTESLAAIEPFAVLATLMKLIADLR
jgi:heptosyltransferase-2